MNTNGFVETKIENNIASIEFGHPASNSLPGAVLNSLAENILLAGKNTETNVIILRSAGERAFCAGASFDELIAIESMEQGEIFFSGFAKVINAIRSCGKIVIGRVQGKAVGGGVGLACSCDYTFATEHASVKLSELAVGIGPFVVGPAVERKIGLTAFSQMSLDASTFYTAAWAKEKGMYAETFASIEAMDEKVNAFATQLAQSNPEALSALKKIFWENYAHWESLLYERASTSGRLVLSSFTRQAIAKFKQ